MGMDELHDFAFKLQIKRSRFVWCLCLLWAVLGIVAGWALSTYGFGVLWLLLFSPMLVVFLVLFVLALPLDFVSGREPPNSSLTCRQMRLGRIEHLVLSDSFGRVSFPLDSIERVTVCQGDEWEDDSAILHGRLTLFVRSASYGHIVSLPLPMSSKGVADLVPVLQGKVMWI